MKIDDLVILVGGKGTRISKITYKTPKPLIRINKIPFLDQLIANKLRYEFKRIFLLCSFKKNIFFKKYHNKKIHKTKIICIDEGSSKDTAGGLYKLRKILKKRFILINGDTFFDFDMNEFAIHKLNNNIGAMALTKVNILNNQKKINNLKINKSKKVFFSNYRTNLINGGTYLFDKRIFKFIKNRKQSLENEVLKELILKKKINGFLSNRKFIDIGSYKEINYLKNHTTFIKNKAFFLDRDGVINEDKGYILNYSQFKFLNGVKKGINYISKKGYLIIILTNQAAIGKGLLSEKKLHSIHQKMKKNLNKKNLNMINDIYYAPYFKDSKISKYRLNHNDRKPNIGMFTKAIKKWNIDINKSFFIGDKKTDFLAAKKTKIKFFYKMNIPFYKQIINII